jgi:hypothetical protein
MIIEDSINKKLSEFDFLRGAEDYKYNWTKEHRFSVKVAIWKSKADFYEIESEKILRKLIKMLIPRSLNSKLYKILINRK